MGRGRTFISSTSIWNFASFPSASISSAGMFDIDTDWDDSTFTTTWWGFVPSSESFTRKSTLVVFAMVSAMLTVLTLRPPSLSAARSSPTEPRQQETDQRFLKWLNNLLANQRCGAWYVPPSVDSHHAYFKSTDGHIGVRSRFARDPMSPAF